MTYTRSRDAPTPRHETTSTRIARLGNLEVVGELLKRLRPPHRQKGVQLVLGLDGVHHAAVGHTQLRLPAPHPPTTRKVFFNATAVFQPKQRRTLHDGAAMMTLI